MLLAEAFASALADALAPALAEALAPRIMTVLEQHAPPGEQAEEPASQAPRRQPAPPSTGTGQTLEDHGRNGLPRPRRSSST